VIGKAPIRRLIHPYQDILDGELIKNKINIMVRVRVKFSADLVVEAETLEQAHEKWITMPLFSKEAEDCGVEYNETLLVENAGTYEEIDWYE
jgi:hypothetical protein